MGLDSFEGVFWTEDIACGEEHSHKHGAAWGLNGTNV